MAKSFTFNEEDIELIKRIVEEANAISYKYYWIETGFELSMNKIIKTNFNKNYDKDCDEDYDVDEILSDCKEKIENMKNAAEAIRDKLDKIDGFYNPNKFKNVTYYLLSLCNIIGEVKFELGIIYGSSDGGLNTYSDIRKLITLYEELRDKLLGEAEETN